MNGFVDAAKFGNRLGEFRRAFTNLERSHDRGGLYDSQLKRASQAQQIVPMLRNEIWVDPVSSYTVQRPIIRRRINAPIAGAAHIDNSWTESKAEQPEQTQARREIPVQHRRRALGLLLRRRDDRRVCSLKIQPWTGTLMAALNQPCVHWRRPWFKSLSTPPMDG